MYGLLGRKLGHSLSPQIHAKFGDYPYELICREPEELDEFFADEKYTAYNITIPYKIDAYNHCDVLSETAKKVGSVNTIVRKDGKLYGDNTDFFGFEYMAKKYGADFNGKKVVVLGNGGASLTIQKVAQEHNARQIAVVDLDLDDNYDNIDRHYDSEILVNATPVGMYPKNLNRLVDLSKFTKLECVLDVIYNPAKTQLLLDAEKLGIPCGNGLNMLVAQGLRSAEQFFDKKFGDETIDRVYNEMLDEQTNIVLIGMPGCGKSTVGKLLAEKLGKTFVDTDEEIIKADGRSIPEIFSTEGEEFFRNLETEACKNVGKNLFQVIATGGGAIMREINRDALYQNGKIVYLTRDTEKLAVAGRPLSKDENAVKEIYKKRKPIYESFAEYTVEVDPDPQVTLERVMKCISL